jgi:predicted RNA-binding protein YlxR (DUF448 family)
MLAVMTAGARPRRKRAPQPKHLPQRTCVGCRTVLAKRQLVRLVRTAAGSVEIDPTGKAQGRGAYLHDRRECWNKALASGALEHALRVILTEAERARLRAHGEQYSNDD